jgi:hypothetical protein
VRESLAEKYRREAAECRDKAERADNQVDKQSWLKLADDWGRLARGEDLRTIINWSAPLGPYH